MLKLMADGGDSLTASRPIRFTSVFPDERSAKAFGGAVPPGYQVVDVKKAEVVDGFPWEVEVERDMVPELAAVTNSESTLADLAARFDGEPDGWCCERIVDQPDR